MTPEESGGPVAASAPNSCFPGLPQVRVCPDETDALLAKEMRQMSTEERDEVFHDIHGVSEVVEESPEFLGSRLQRLELEISNISKKDAYQLAKSMNTEYVRNRTFRLKFLRCDRFDTRKAAARIVNHFEWKLELFGPAKIAKDIVQDDLDPEELEILRSHNFQVQPLRDSSGRAILCWIPCLAAKSSKRHRVSLQLLACAGNMDQSTGFLSVSNPFVSHFPSASPSFLLDDGSNGG